MKLDTGIMKTSKWYKYLIPSKLTLKNNFFVQYRWLNFYLAIYKKKESINE